eukprot:Amastigsp_a2589_13.p6 type:complete len:119 gc:universal Amastigsp_a2589_13:1440-1084(-)
MSSMPRPSTESTTWRVCAPARSSARRSSASSSSFGVTTTVWTRDTEKHGSGRAATFLSASASLASASIDSRGMNSDTVVPWPSLVRTSIVPPSLATSFCTMAPPSPSPSNLRDTDVSA